jgi:hypothetical protein
VRHRLHPDADAEFADAVRYYAEIAPVLGARFYREIERLIRDVCAHPDRFRKFNPPETQAGLLACTAWLNPRQSGRS